MGMRLWGIVLGLATLALLSGCAPLIIGGGGAIIADQVVEDQNGGDGLF
jgi:hypothetical protein